MMYRAFAALAALVLLTHCCVPPDARVAETDLVDFLIDTTIVLVEDDRAGGWNVSCSGVWTSSDEFLTAYHCIEDAGMPADMGILNELLGFSLWDPTGQSVHYMTRRQMAGTPIEKMQEAFVGKIVKVSRDKDLALIHTSNTDHPYAEIAGYRPEVGQLVHTMGHTAGMVHSYSPGWISAVRQMETLRGEALMVQVVGGAWKGNSGGGVFDNDGRLLGITSFLLNGTILTFHTSGAELRKFLDS